MNPSETRQTVLLGLFVSVAVLILAGGILMVGTLKNTFTQKISVSTVFDEVGGLSAGDNIWFSGMKVGTVKSLAFSEDSQVRVELRIDESAAPFIHSDVQAKVGSDGLIGNRIVILYGGSTESASLKEGDVIQMGDAVTTDEMMATLQENNTNLMAITSDIKQLTAALVAGEGSVGQLLKDDTLYTSLKQTSGELNVASTNARQLTASLATFSAQLNQEGTLAHDLANDKTTYASVTEAVDKLKHTSEVTAALVDDLALKASDPETPLGTVISDDVAGADLKVTLDQLKKSSKLLREDLEALQHTFLLRRGLRKAAEANAAEAP